MKGFLQIWLARAANSLNLGLEMPGGGMSSYTVGADEIKAQMIPLYQVKDKTQVIYVSPFTLKWSKSSLGSSTDTALAIAKRLCELINPSEDDNQQLFTIKVDSPGSINIQLADLTIAIWLQNLTKILPLIEQEKVSFRLVNSLKKTTAFSVGSSSSVFSAQYAHARCCSLLRLAHRERIIVLEEPDPETTPIYWKTIAPQPIPWLNRNNRLRLVDPAERNLIYDFFGVLDILYCLDRQKNPISGATLANTICQSFEQFYRQCRIWGEVKTDEVDLARARLGLVAIAQALLRLFLVDFLGVSAPLEL